MPGYYYHPKTIDDQVDFIVGKILDYIGIEYLPHTKKECGELDFLSSELMTT
jgi:3-polyprenyl-4-hydroxybenzoate decarboxylase